MKSNDMSRLRENDAILIKLGVVDTMPSWSRRLLCAGVRQ